ncbi:MAG: type VII toxin-antitoxin system HepT family RNase toxin [Gemmatimonadota bacterium]
MTLVERLLELRIHLGHLREIRPTISGTENLESNISLRNDVLHSLQTVCQAVIDIAAELSAREGLPFQDYTEAVRNLARTGPFSAKLVKELEALPGFRNIVIHEYVELDLEWVTQALDRLAPIETFAAALSEHLAEAE